ncbi:MAG: hypothetical protein LBK43_04710 [Treponema sp.]|jgi:hypothetical protein|nr:hypothetical protein [Treponema sp.]
MKNAIPRPGYQYPTVHYPLRLKGMVLLRLFQVIREYSAEPLRFKPIKQPGNLHAAGYVLHFKERFKVIPLQFPLHLLLKVHQGGDAERRRWQMRT